ncbi:tRNA pseudouridine(38/39) synthase [Smittium culicis]|uniref:tRNA pseudouridine(38/39) synthase n=1 Tax=Smittium culicis TaxID=133412 RepID=A0A1R1XEN4_9FUNG|nr:tRNA pseudouridine(38/39) synthase [Smittium culicis]
MSSYSEWSKDQLIDRIKQLEAAQRVEGGPICSGTKPFLEKGGLSVSKIRDLGNAANILAGAVDVPGTANEDSSRPSKKQKKGKSKDKTKEFDFSKYPKRKVALKLSYLGCKYYGFARQGNVVQKADEMGGNVTFVPEDLPTVEGELFRALIKCKLRSWAGNIVVCAEQWEICGRCRRWG